MSYTPHPHDSIEHNYFILSEEEFRAKYGDAAYEEFQATDDYHPRGKSGSSTANRPREHRKSSTRQSGGGGAAGCLLLAMFLPVGALIVIIIWIFIISVF